MGRKEITFIDDYVRFLGKKRTGFGLRDRNRVRILWGGFEPQKDWNHGVGSCNIRQPAANHFQFSRLGKGKTNDKRKKNKKKM